MGLFSSKKIITVSSTVYNMAGDEDDRPNFLKGTLFGSIIANNPSLADDITKSYFNGPGMKQKQFFRYCDRVNLPGMPTTTITNSVKVDAAVIAAQIPPSAVPPAPAGLELTAYSAEVNDGDFEPWLQRWIYENYPTREGENWLGEYDPATNMFSVEFPNNDFFTWENNVAPVYSPSKRYIVAKYIEFLPNSEDAVVEGTPTTGVTSLPDLSEFTETDSSTSFTSVTLQRTRTTIHSYNNGDPDELIEDEVDADVAGELSTDEATYEREVFVAQTGISIEGEKQIWTIINTDTVGTGYEDIVVVEIPLGGGVIRTETSTTTGEQVVESWTTEYDTQAIYTGALYGNEKIFIYEVGTGNAVLDALVSSVDASGFQEFFPFMPIRLNNVSMFEEQYDDLRNDMKKAYRRGFQGKSFNKLIETVEDNESIEDIDYAYLMFGCSLNVKDMACRKYIYKFFEKLIPFQSGGSGTAMSDLNVAIADYEDELAAFDVWVSSPKLGLMGDILPRPPLPNGVKIPSLNTIRLVEGNLGFDIRLSWIHAETEQFEGTYNTDPGAGVIDAPKVDDLYLVAGPNVDWEERIEYNESGEGGDGLISRMLDKSVKSMYIFWQVTPTTYRRMTVWGMNHQNFIYGGKSVSINSTEALEDPDESGFVIPLHYPTMSEMSIVDYTQMCTANSLILFNSYEVTKQKWYQKGIFKILLVIAVIIIAVIVFPGAFAGGGGILGGNLAVGSALGLTGTAALVAGVVANYIASIIISQVLSLVGTALFGEKWGAVFAAIAGFALSAGVSGTKIFSAEGILGLGNAIANGYSGYVAGDINEMQGELEDDGKDYERRMDEIQDLIDGMGGNNLNFNPLFLTDSSYGNAGRNTGGSRGYLPETADQYIRRTTMSGSDVVDLTFSMIYDFVDVQKTLPRN